MKSEIIPYLFEDNIVRTVTQEGEPWFVASDVCLILGIEKHRDALSRLEDDERGSVLVDTLGGPQGMGAINESGLYALIFKSRKPEARRFRKWVTADVLPAIRRTGTYGTNHKIYLDLLRDQIELGVSPDVAAKCALRMSPQPSVIDKLVAPQHPQLSEMEDVLTRMETGKAYTIDDIAALLPPKHTLIYKRTIPSIASSIGKLMERARQFEKIEKVRGRRAAYRLLAEIIPIAEGR